jgi:hypothetical protein
LTVDALLVSAAATHQFKDGEEDVDRVEIDGEGERDCGAAISAGADAGEVAYGEQAEDAEREPGVGVRREEVEEHAGDSGDDQQQKRGEAYSGDAAVVDVEEICDAAHHGHASAGGGGGVEDDGGAEVVDVALDEGTDLPAHEVGEGEKKSERNGGVGLAGEVDGEDKTQDDDEADEGPPGGRGGDANGGDEEAERGYAEHLGQQRRGLLACAFDGDRIVLIHTVVVHGLLFCSVYFNTMRRLCGWFVMSGAPPPSHVFLQSIQNR